MTVKAWLDYWISMKKRTVRPNTVRNYTERYERNIDPVIGKHILSEVKPIQCQSTIYQTRITLFNMLDYAYQNDVIMKNPCNGMVKSDIGKPKTLQTILGHSNIGITMNLYVHTTEDEKHKDHASMAQNLF